MSRLFYIGIILAIILLFLFFPIFLSLSAHYDLNRKKFCFSLNVYKNIRLVGGYISPYPKGVAVHISDKKAVLVQYTEFERESKKFSFFKTLRLHRLHVMTETGAHYLLGIYMLVMIAQIINSIKTQSSRTLQTGVSLINGDVLRISARAIWVFNGCTVLKECKKVLKEKIDSLWKKKTRKSIG